MDRQADELPPVTVGILATMNAANRVLGPPLRSFSLTFERLGALAGVVRLVPSVVGRGGDCTVAANRGFMAGASRLEMTTLITPFSWSAAAARAFDEDESSE